MARAASVAVKHRVALVVHGHAAVHHLTLAGETEPGRLCEILLRRVIFNLIEVHLGASGGP
jgi:hypothetical protein